MTIPKYIHQIWYQNWSNLPSKYVENVKSVIDMNPGWTHLEWDDSSMREVMKSIGQEYLDKYDSFQLMHQKIDFGRIGILYMYGGVSVDTDARSLKGFDSTPHIDTADLIVSYNSSNEIENLVKAKIPVVLINATILVKPKHPVLKKLLDHILTLSCQIGTPNYDCIQDTTGPRAFTKYLLDNFKDQIIILNHNYFDPCNGNDTECEIPATAILDQQQEGSWANPAYKRIAQVWYWTKRRWIWLLLLIVIVIIAFSATGKKQ